MNNETSYFLFQIMSFKKYFYVSLDNIFYCFVEAPLVVEAVGNCPVCPPLNPTLRITVMHESYHTEPAWRQQATALTVENEYSCAEPRHSTGTLPAITAKHTLLAGVDI